MAIENFCDAQIDQLDAAVSLVIAREHQVVRGDVPVDDVLVMKVTEREEGLMDDFQAQPETDRPKKKKKNSFQLSSSEQPLGR